MPKNPEESSKNLEPTVTSSENQPIVVGSDADASTNAVMIGNASNTDEKHRKNVAPPVKQNEPVVAADGMIDQRAVEQYIQARLASAAANADKNDPNTNISWIPSFMKSLTKTRSSNDDDGSDDSTNTDSDDDSRPDSDASAESSNPGGAIISGGAESNDEHPPLQAPITRSAMQFHPIFPQSMDIPPPLNQWHLYNQQKSFNAPAPPPPPRCPEPSDLPSIQAVKKSKRRKSSGKHKTPRKKTSKEKREEETERPIKPPELRELPTTAAPRTNYNQAPKSGPTCQPNYCPPCAQAPNLPPCPPTMTIPSCSQPLSACIPPASAMPAGMAGGMNGNGMGGNGMGGNGGCAAAVSDPCNPCISGGYRSNNFQGGNCPDVYPPQADICKPSNCYPQQQQQQQCCPQPQAVNCAPVELCEKSVCYCEKCENPDPNVPPQYNMQQWTCKFLRPVENQGYYPNGNGRGGGGFDGGGFQMPQGGPPSGMPGMPGCNGNATTSAGGMGGGMNGGGGGMGGCGLGGGGGGGPMSAMGPGPMGPGAGTMGPGSMGPATSMGFNPMCNPVCNPNYGQPPPGYQQPTGGRGCPPPGGYGSGCPPPGNPPMPPRCPIPCAPRCPPRTCYQKTFTDWGENDPRDALMSRITVYPTPTPPQQQQQQHHQQQQHQRSFESARTPTPMHHLRSAVLNPQFNPNFNPNAHTNMVAYHPELFQVTGAISAPAPRFEETMVPQSPRYVNTIRTPQVNAQAYKRPRSMYMKEPTGAAATGAMDMAEPDLLSTRASQLRYHYSQQRRSDTPRVAASKKTEIYNGDIDWKSEPKLHSSETVASKLRRQHNRNKLKEINDG